MEPKMTYMTQDEIVNELVSRLETEDIDYLRSLEENRVGILHHSYGRHIRNTYKLWEAENPLVAQWFTDCDEAPNGDHKYIIDGVDCHPQHPDAVSMDIVRLIWAKYQN